MKLTQNAYRIGVERHRSGWPFVMSHVVGLDDKHGVLFDDFMERTLMYNPVATVTIDEPWVAISHHPSCELPEPFADLYQTAKHHHKMRTLPGREEALNHLRGIIALSDHAKAYLETQYDVPITVLRHPTDLSVSPFNWTAYQECPQMVHVGWFLKNLLLPWQIPTAKPIQYKLYVKPRLGHTYHNMLQDLQDRWGQTRTRYPDVVTFNFMTNREYDQMLRQTIVCCEFFDCSAANTLLECMARNTPILVNRHPAVVEYLGEDYPLYFDDVTECPDLLQHRRVYDAHQYMEAMDKEHLSVGYFCEQLKGAVAQWESA